MRTNCSLQAKYVHRRTSQHFAYLLLSIRRLNFTSVRLRKIRLPVVSLVCFAVSIFNPSPNGVRGVYRASIIQVVRRIRKIVSLITIALSPKSLRYRTWLREKSSPKLTETYVVGCMYIDVSWRFGFEVIAIEQLFDIEQMYVHVRTIEQLYVQVRSTVRLFATEQSVLSRIYMNSWYIVRTEQLYGIVRSVRYATERTNNRTGCSVRCSVQNNAAENCKSA